MPQQTTKCIRRRSFLQASAGALAASSFFERATGAAAERSLLEPTSDIAKQLAALPPNHGLLLGTADVVGDFNDTAREFELHKTGPRARDFSLKMCWAPERKRALYCGANHAVPHRLNDVWEFDLTSLTWSLLYAPDLPRGYTDFGKDASDAEFRDGLFVTKRGGPAIIAHSWWGLTYDPQQRALLLMNAWVTEQKKMAEQLGGDPAELYAGPPLWAFFPESGKWRPLKADKPYPMAIFGGMLEYVPELKGNVWHANNWQMQGTWLHDFEKDAWRDLNANGGGKAFAENAPEPEQIGYYDPQRKLLVVHRHYKTHHYDIQKNEWKVVRTGSEGDDRTPYGHDARAVFYHYPESGKGLLVQFETNTLWEYDPDGVTWTKLQLKGDAMPIGGKRLAYVDPALGVLAVIDGTTVWAYRR